MMNPALLSASYVVARTDYTRDNQSISRPAIMLKHSAEQIDRVNTVRQFFIFRCRHNETRYFVGYFQVNPSSQLTLFWNTPGSLATRCMQPVLISGKHFIALIQCFLDFKRSHSCCDYWSFLCIKLCGITLPFYTDDVRVIVCAPTDTLWKKTLHIDSCMLR